MTERKVKLDRANKSILLRALGELRPLCPGILRRSLHTIVRRLWYVTVLRSTRPTVWMTVSLSGTAGQLNLAAPKRVFSWGKLRAGY